MNRRMPLDQVGNVRGGYVAATATVDRREASSVRALQAADVAADGTIPWDALGFVAASPDGGRYGINQGDVLVPLRSVRTTAIVVQQVPPGVIAVGHWAIISPDPARADPEFLAWYLNHPATAPRLAGLMRGTRLRFLSLTDLRRFEVELPPLPTQRRIARTSALHARVVHLEREQAAARKQLLDAATLAALRGSPDPNPKQTRPDASADDKPQ